MNESRARIMRDLIHRFGARDILEIGFFRGKSSAYIGAILEDQGAGKLTTIDRLTAPRNYLGLAPQMVDRVLNAASRKG